MSTLNGVIRKKIEIIQETLLQMQNVDDLTLDKLESDFFFKRGIERSVQICIEAVIDIAHRIISFKNQKPVSSAGKALEVLQQLGIINDADAYKKMVQFRNLLVHRYEIIDNDVLLDIVRNHLHDFTLFIDEILQHEED